MQRPHTDKYVSAYVSSDNHADMSFSNPILQDSADHYRVAIDDLTVNLSNLSMLEYDAGGANVLFRIKRLGHIASNEDMTDVAHMPTEGNRKAFEFAITRPYNSLSEIMERMCEIGRAVGTFIKSGAMNNAVVNLWNVTAAANAASDVNTYLRFDLTNGGLLRIMGNKLFWSNFVIEVPNVKYRYLLFRAFSDAEFTYISVHPETNAQHIVPYINSRPQAFVDADGNPWTAANNAADHAYEDPVMLATRRIFTGGMCLCNSLDRRVALEVGCSLPLKNSPMVDHGQEAPDFVLGRFNLTSQNHGISDPNAGTMAMNLALGSRQLQGPRDRICYHHLGPQQKIQALRLRLWARVRTYDPTTKKWGMQTIMCPMKDSDFWHIKLHFLHKSK
jgi:hypothetical protein